MDHIILTHTESFSANWNEQYFPDYDYEYKDGKYVNVSEHYPLEAMTDVADDVVALYTYTDVKDGTISYIVHLAFVKNIYEEDKNGYVMRDGKTRIRTEVYPNPKMDRPAEVYDASKDVAYGIKNPTKLIFKFVKSDNRYILESYTVAYGRI